MVRHAPIHRRSGHSDIAICCGRNVRGSSPSTSVVPLSNQVTPLNHKRLKGFKMFSDGHLQSFFVQSAFFGQDQQDLFICAKYLFVEATQASNLVWHGPCTWDR